MLLTLPATRPAATKAASGQIADVTVSDARPPENVRYRAVVSRSLRQTAVVEFTARQGMSQWEMGEMLKDQVPEDAYGEPEMVEGSGLYVQTMEEIGPATDAPASGMDR